MTIEQDEWTRGDWMQLHSGARFHPADPRAEDIDIRDIAHALSLICRYGGHISKFYSVAEHCVLMSECVDPENRLAALLHDATEAYVGDVVRPLKRLLPDYQRIELGVWAAITDRFELPLGVPAQVKDADNRILLTERDALMPNTRYSWEVDGLAPLPVVIEAWSPKRAERYYLARFRTLMKENA